MSRSAVIAVVLTLGLVTSGCDDSDDSCSSCTAGEGGGAGASGASGDSGASASDGGPDGSTGPSDCRRKHPGPCIGAQFNSSGEPGEGGWEYVHELESGTVSPMIDPPPVARYVRKYEGDLMTREEYFNHGVLKEVRTYEYDEHGRITMELRDEDANGEDEEGSLYRYDAQGRLESLFCYNLTDEADCTGEDFTYRAWDENGNPTERVAVDFPAQVSTYQYDESCDLVREEKWREQDGTRDLTGGIEYDYSCW